MSEPKLIQSAADWCYYRPEHGDGYYRRLRDAGYQAVEMTPPERWNAARSAGLELRTLGAPGMEQGINHPENHAALLPQIRDLIRVAADNGVPSVIVFSGNRNGQEDRVGIGHCTSALAGLAEQAEASGVTLLLEVLNSFEHRDYQCDSMAYAVAVARAVNSPRVRILYDLYHGHRMGEDVIAAVAENLPLVGHLHVAGSPKRDFPGAAQALDYRAAVRAIYAAGYRGCWGQEFLPKGDCFTELLQARELFDSYVA